MTRARRRLAWFPCLLATLAGWTCAGDSDEPYLERRARFTTRLVASGTAPAPLGGEPAEFPGWAPSPEHVRAVSYPSGDLTLRARVYVPPAGSAKSPALLYLHGGLTLGANALSNCKPFIEAGFVVMAPALRGEDGNPGHFELAMGEVDDAAAAARWLAAQSFTDPERVFAVGWSSGGIVAALLSLFEDTPLRHSASIGGLITDEFFDRRAEILPFDPGNPLERQMRLLIGNLRWMRHRHYAYVGSADSSTVASIDAARREMDEDESLLTIVTVPGDHFSSFPAAIAMYFDVVQQTLEDARRR